MTAFPGTKKQAELLLMIEELEKQLRINTNWRNLHRTNFKNAMFDIGKLKIELQTQLKELKLKDAMIEKLSNAMTRNSTIAKIRLEDTTERLQSALNREEEQTGRIHMLIKQNGIFERIIDRQDKQITELLAE